ncbi:MAG: MFS transporter [Candidatus Cloacimonadota bacterium]|nr:MFS transporter [Candidatus Cloacimonadota bacterium]
MKKDLQYYKFCAYGFFKNQRYFDPFIILFFRAMGFSFLEIGTLFSVREISIIVLEIPTGVIADSFGRKNSMLVAFSSYILSFLIFYFFPSFGLYVFAMILYGMGTAFRSGTHKAMIFEYLKINNIFDQKVEYYGHTRGASLFGSAVSSLIAGAFVLYTGNYKIIFAASIIPYIFDFFLILSYPNELNGVVSSISEKNIFTKTKLQFGIVSHDFIRMFKNRNLFTSIFNSAVYDGLFKTIKDYLQPILQMYILSIPLLLSLGNKRSTIMISVVYFFLFLLTSYSSRRSHKYSQIFPSLPYAINFTFVLGIALAFLAGFFSGINLQILSVIIFIILYSLQNLKRPMNVGYIGDNLQLKIMASGLSVESQIKSIITAILSPILGFLVDDFGVGAGLMIISGIVILFYPLVKIRKTTKS